MTDQIVRYSEKSIFSKLADHLRHANELGELKNQIRRERDELRKLTDRELQDIGISREEALAEANRKYDDIPEHRIGNWFCR